MTVEHFRLLLLSGSLLLNCVFIFLVIKLLDDRKDLRLQNNVMKTHNEHMKIELKGYYDKEIARYGREA
jgi:hypothetical protein